MGEGIHNGGQCGWAGEGEGDNDLGSDEGVECAEGDMVGRAGRCGGGWSVGSGLREQKGDQVGERQRGPGEGARVV